MKHSAHKKTFTLVLAGGGARGFAHAGVLRALEDEGYLPSAIVGVSMGAVVGVTYALRSDWYDALLAMKTDAFPAPFRTTTTTRRPVGEVIAGYARGSRMVWEMFFGWGPGERAVGEGRAALRELTGGRRLGDARIPVAVSATDLESGRRHIIRSGNAIDALYASSALAGVLPPLRLDGKMLADGAYSDIAPIDVARAFGHPVVIAVDPGQSLVPIDVRNGYQAVMRAMEICHMRHADARFAEADLVLRPAFQRTIDTLDFGARQECIAAGTVAVRRHRPDLASLLTDQREPAARGTAPERHPAVGLSIGNMNNENDRED